MRVEIHLHDELNKKYPVISFHTEMEIVPQVGEKIYWDKKSHNAVYDGSLSEGWLPFETAVFSVTEAGYRVDSEGGWRPVVTAFKDPQNQ